MMLAQSIPTATVSESMSWVGLALLFPVLSAVLCTLMAALRFRGKGPAIVTAIALGASFAVILRAYLTYSGTPVVIPIFDWIDFQWSGGGTFKSFAANMSLYVDRLTLFWMLFVTGLGTLITVYASEYMESDRGTGYCRFFFGISIFLASMTALVMSDNLVMLYLGWEGVGLASYLLIGYYYTRPSAVAAAKKAFIVNRIGDLGLALGIFLIWSNYGTVQYDTLFASLSSGGWSGSDWDKSLIPYLLMLGAFGKSAQIPLYVWLPDAMEGPTPVSALIHAATMVTAGVYLIARTYPLFELHPDALTTVAWIGGGTALLAATIGMAQYDMKRVFAYSTISQLGYMFLGLGVGSTFAAAYHTFTHAFFKALLFLTAGAVMHGFGGQLDIRKLSGLLKVPGFRIVGWMMLVGCLWLSALPYSAAFFSKDEIILAAFINGDKAIPALGWIALGTAALTAYYTFRVWFRVWLGPVRFEPDPVEMAHMAAAHGADHGHGANDHDSHGHDAHGHAATHGAGSGHHDSHDFHPHAPRLAINAVLVILGIGAVLAGLPSYLAMAGRENWVQWMIEGSSAYQGAGTPGGDHSHATILGMDAHRAMLLLGGCATFGGIAVAAWLHLLSRASADRLRNAMLANPLTRWIPLGAERKWLVDEFYHWVLRLPLWIGGQIMSFADRHVLDGALVSGFGKLPLALGRLFRPLYGGPLQGYAVTMAGGVALVLAWVVWMWTRGAH
jgi:NADH-quinone oxidoreductase subunit L